MAGGHFDIGGGDCYRDNRKGSTVTKYRVYGTFSCKGWDFAICLCY